MPPQYKVMQDGSLEVTFLTRTSKRARVLYWILMTFFSPVISNFIENPTASGHQHIKVPKSLQKAYIVKKRSFEDWTFYDISQRPKEGFKPAPPEQATDGPANTYTRRVIYIPGTSFTIPASSEHFKFAVKAFLKDANTLVSIIIHPLAPKHTVNTVYPKFFDLYQQLVEEVAPSTKIVLGGDSSGGGVALSITQRFAERGLRLPDQLFLMAPSLDFVQPRAADMKEVSKSDPLQKVEDSHRDHLKWVGDDLDLADPIVSPLRGDFSRMKGVKVIGTAGTYDILEPDTVKLRTIFKEENIDCEWLVGDQMIHCWPLMQAYKIPEAVQATQWIAEKMEE